MQPSGAAVDLSGIFVPVTTPFDTQSEALDLKALEANLMRLRDAEIRGVAVAGTTGEAVFLTREERREALSTARALLPEDRFLIAGTGCESTRETLRLCQEAEEAGANLTLVQPPAYYRKAMTPLALAEHYRIVADQSPLPIILYQVPPACSSMELLHGLVAELSGHPNIVGIKDSRGDLDALGRILEGVHSGFQVLVGNGAKLYAALEMGAVGGILGVANLAPAEAVALHRSFHEGRVTEAGRLQERIGPVHNAIVGALGVPGVKAALDLLGRHGGRPRRPLRPLGEEDVARVGEALREAGLLDTSRGPA